MARIENRGVRTWDITALPDKDGKPGAVYSIPHRHRETSAPGTGEIPDAVLKDLMERDDFTKGAFASGNDLVVVHGKAAEVEPDGKSDPKHRK